jgi:carboxypeptidase C (cathepsin A)
MDVLPTKYNKEFLNSTATPFIDSDKKEIGYVRSAGKGAGNVAYMAIYEAGHMVCSSVELMLAQRSLTTYYLIGTSRSTGRRSRHAPEMARQQAPGSWQVIEEVFDI